MWKTPTILVGIVLLLLALGIVMLASASSVKGVDVHNDSSYFLKRQMAWLVVALVAGLFTASVDYHRWRDYWIPITVLAAALLVLVLIPHIGFKIGGSRRWLKVGPISFQPSELAKFAVVIMLSAWTTRVGRKASTFLEGILKPGVMLGILLGLIFLEPDFGTTMLVAVVGGALLFVGGSPWPYLLGGGIVGLAGFMAAILHDDVRRGRILAFLMPDKYPAAAYQLHQSMEAFTLGGFWGVGLGESLQKQYFLPEAHTDFILAIIGEELGLVVTCLVIALFAGFLICGIIISLQAPDLFGRLLGTGFTLMTAIQAVINVGVVTGCMPTKGLPLPFISYGGSSLLMSMIAVGVLVNIARQRTVEADQPRQAVRDKCQWI
jgi:cell division protein FtsW